MTVLATPPQVGLWTGVVTNPDQRVWLQHDAVPQHAGAPQNTRNTIKAQSLPTVGVANALPTLTPGTPPTFQAKAPTHDFHERIWIFPPEMLLRNPALGTNIPFQVWNTFLNRYKNTFVGAALQDLTGIETDLTPGEEYTSNTHKTQYLWLTPEAGMRMNGLLLATFEDGAGQMRIIVERASVVPVVPDAPVTERWIWQSDVMVSENGTEQRQSLSSSPRRETDFNLTVIYPDEANAVIKQLFADSASAIVLPMYQYLVGLKQTALAGSLLVQADPVQGDLRVGQDISLYNRKVGHSLNKIEAINGDWLTLANPLDTDLQKGTWLVPLASTYLSRQTQFERAAADGFATLSTVATDVEPLSPFLSAANVVALPMFNGLPIIEDRPLVSGGMVAASYDNGTERIDYGGAITMITPWAHSQIDLAREYYVDRFFSPAEMHRWRSLMDYCRGRVKPFYVPTFRPDLAVATPPGVGANTLHVLTNNYSGAFFGKGIMDQIAIFTEAGVHYSTVLSATPGEDGNDTITLQSPLPTDAGWNEIRKISFILRCRLANDKVELEHHALHSLIRISIRTTNQ